MIENGNEKQYFCWVCGKDTDDSPKILKKYKPTIYKHVLYCANCETYFVLDTSDQPKRISKRLVKYFIYM